MSKRGLPTNIRMRHEAHFVEELAGRSGAPVGRMIPLTRLEPNPQQPRAEIGELGELVNSIREKGVLEPILVRPSEVGGRFMIISGERRYRAGLLAGLKEIPCIEMDVDDCNVAEIALIENIQRKDLTPFEEAMALQSLIDRFGYTHEQVAHKLGKSRTSITESMSLASLPVEIQAECRRADITSKSILLHIARQADVESMLKLVQQVANFGLTREQLRQKLPVKNAKSKPFTYRFQPETKEYRIDVKFSRGEVSRQEIIVALELLLAEIKNNPANE